MQPFLFRSFYANRSRVDTEPVHPTRTRFSRALIAGTDVITVDQALRVLFRALCILVLHWTYELQRA